jgi:sarcosine oxidase subunit beta
LRVDDVAVAGVTEGAGYTDTEQYTEWLASTAERAGATIETHTPVEIATSPPRVVHEDGTEREVNTLVVAAGAHSKQLLAEAGIAIAMKPYRVQALVGTASVTEPMWYDTTADCYARPHPDGLLAGNGTEEREADPDAYDRTANEGFAPDLADRVTHRMPDRSLSVQTAWAGLCTATPDRNPLVGELSDGLYVATGFQGQGFMRSPAIGRRLANQILGDNGIDPYDPTRFTGDEAFSIREGMAIEP